MQKVFYDKNKKIEIIDISGVKTLEQIKNEFGEGDYEEVSFNPLINVQTTKNGRIELLDLEMEKTQRKNKAQADKLKRTIAKNKIKDSIGLTEEETDILFGD